MLNVLSPVILYTEIIFHLVDEHEHIHGSSRNNVLDFTLAYNVTDWTSGYFGDIGGFIAYFSAPGQGEELR